MASKKNFYYVLVFEESCPVYVTKVNNSCRVAHWNKGEKPLSMCKTSAEDLAMGLNLNFSSAVVVWMPYEIETQPYRYEAFDLMFVGKGEKA